MAAADGGQQSDLGRIIKAELDHFERHLKNRLAAEKEMSPSARWERLQSPGSKEPTVAHQSEGPASASASTSSAGPARGRRSVKAHAQWRGSEHEGGVWVQLLPPEGVDSDSREWARSVEAFLSEAARSVEELPESPSGGSEGRLSHASTRRRDIGILDSDEAEGALLLDRLPEAPGIRLVPSPYQIQRQMQAVRILRDSPSPDHRPLLRLLEPGDRASWPALPGLVSIAEDEWVFLREAERSGTTRQREFVQRALTTPDFVLLEGPPGSGKSTAISELVAQEVLRGGRVLLCASTHVAVDNVLSSTTSHPRLAPHLVPVRVGKERSVAADMQAYSLDRVVSTLRKEVLMALPPRGKGRPGQEAMRECVEGTAKGGQEEFKRAVLEACNLVAGTCIGVLAHPEIKEARGGTGPTFDLLIIDESSKTTLAEFLVPARLAKRWILVGDYRQLPPYTDPAVLQHSLLQSTGLPLHRREALLGLALSEGLQDPQDRHPRPGVLSTSDPILLKAYRREAEARGYLVATPADDVRALAIADLVLASPDDPGSAADFIPLFSRVIGGTGPLVETVRARQISNGRPLKQPASWEAEFTWRLMTYYELREPTELAAPAAGAESGGTPAPIKRGPHSGQEGIGRDLELLLPLTARPETGDFQGSPGLEQKAPVLQDNLRLLRAIVAEARWQLLSVLEGLQRGMRAGKWFDLASGGGDSKCALRSGLPKEALAERLVRLDYQHRMHPDISRFPRETFYDAEALKDAEGMAKDRSWGCDLFGEKRAVWMDVSGIHSDRLDNEAECNAMLRCLDQFRAWAETVGQDRTVALLTFFRAQCRRIARALAVRTKAPREDSEYRIGKRVRVRVCTVDRFQGREADLVLLSFVRHRGTHFLRSPYRMNVALTRAKFQLVGIGHPKLAGDRTLLGATVRDLSQSPLRSLHRTAGKAPEKAESDEPNTGGTRT